MDISPASQALPHEAYYQSCHLVCSDAIITTDSRGVLNSYSRGAQNLLGYLPVEIIGKPFGTILNGGEDEAGRILRRLEERNEVYLFESEVIGKDQKVISVSFSASLLRDREGIAQG